MASSIPDWVLPLITFPAPVAVPPIVLPAEPSTYTPSPELPIADVPAALVPMSFASTVLSDEAESMVMPGPVFPENHIPFAR